MCQNRTRILKEKAREAREMGIRFRTVHVVEGEVEATTITIASVPTNLIGIDGKKYFSVAFAVQSFADSYNKLEGQIRAAGRLCKPAKCVNIGVDKGQRLLDASSVAIVNYIHSRNIHNLQWVKPENLV